MSVTVSDRAAAPATAAAPPQRAGGAAVTRAAWVAGAAGLTLAFTVRPWWDPDSWWHLALGRLITAHSIPSVEPFSFVPAAHAWVGQQWGYEVLLARMVAWGGFGLPMLVMGLLGSAALLIAALAQPRTVRVPGPWLAASLIISGLVAAQVLGVRGQVVTVLGVAVVLLVVTRWREGATRTLWWLPPLFAVWANLHAGFVIGIALLAAVAVTVAVHRAAVPGSEPAARVRGLLAATVLATLATLLNPAGPHLWTYVAQTFLNPTLTQSIVEWSSPSFHDWDMRLMEIEAVALVILWAASRRPDPLDVVLGLGTLAMTLQAQRNVSLFAVVALPQVARYGWLAWRLRPQRPRRPRRPLPAAVAVAAAAIVVAATLAEVAPGLRGSAAADYEARHEPKAAADWVAAHLQGQRLYGTYEWNGYLAERFPTDRVVFVYGESAVFGNAGLQQYLDIHLLRSGWQDRLAALRVGAAIVPASSQETTALLEIGWTVSCHDAASGAVVMRPGGEPPAALPPDPATAPGC